MIKMINFSRGVSLWAALALAAALSIVLPARPAVAQDDPVAVRIVPQHDAVKPGETLIIAVVLEHQNGFHTWPAAGVKLPTDVDEFAIRTEVSIKDLPDWISKVDGIQWPEAHKGRVADPSGSKPTIEVPLYSDTAIAFLRVIIAKSAPGGEQSADISVAYQSCNDVMCTPPQDKALPLSLKVLAAASEEKPADVEPALFAAYKADKVVPFPQPAPAAEASSDAPVDFLEGVKTHVVARHDKVAPGGELVLAVILEHDTGMHTWPAAHEPLPKAVEEFAIRTQVELKPQPEWLAGPAQIQWPKTHTGRVADPTGEKPTIEAPLYDGRSIVYLKVKLADTAKPGKFELPIAITYQACDASTCKPPVDAHIVKASVEISAPGFTAKEADPALFTGFTGQFTAPAPPKAAPPKAVENPAAPAPAQSTSIAGFKLPDPTGPVGILVLFLASCLGGAVLNLTPCVLPIIPIKIITLTKHAGTQSRAMILGIWMAIGVIAFWTILGLPMAFISRQIDASQIIFGIWWLTLSIGLVIVLLGIGIMGLFEFNLPASVTSITPKADSPTGSFMFGVMTAILGLPCFGFMAGGLLAAAATMPTLAIMAVFFGLGVGMGVPYLILSAKPQLLKFVPKTGPASSLVKQVMGLLLLAAAAFYIASGIQTLLIDKPYLSGSLVWWVVAFFILIACLWLLFRTLQITRKPVMRLSMAVLSLILVGGFGAFAYISTAADHESYIAQQAARAEAERLAAAQGGSGGAAILTGVWIPYTPAAFDRAKASGKVVIVDFTASWCITCKALKRGILEQDPVRSRLVKVGAVLLEADCSTSSTDGAKFLKSLGRTGVPTLAVWGPGLAEPLIYNAYTPEVVIAAAEKAETPKASGQAYPILPDPPFQTRPAAHQTASR